ncbi:MAG: FAD-binding protein [Parasporobacterium sp.]|nr:FAD-binding protein [Parasporobacterium sp.]
MEIIKTDILIIGGGSSGLWAAKGAKEQDPSLEVLIVDKSYPDWGGLMSLSGGDLEVCLQGDSPEKWVKDFVYYWDGLCEQDVMEELWQQSHGIFEEYQRLGCTYLKDNEGNYRYVHQRSLDTVKLFPVQTKGTGGKNMRKAMISEMDRLGVKRMGRVEITEILKDVHSGENRTAGAVGFNYVTGQRILFEAQCVILAAGIASWKPSYNQNTASGEGPVLAFRAGAQLQNFEFLHIWNVPKYFEWEGQTVLMPLGAKFVNKNGETFMDRYSPKFGANTDPHYLTRGMALETLAGNAPIHLDLSAIPEKDYPIIKPKAGRQLIHYEKLVEEGIDFFRDEFEWIPVVQLSNGAVKTGRNGESGVDGLYIAGRLRSLDPGVYMGGFALMTTAVTGRQAGRAAADFISGHDRVTADTAYAEKSLAGTFEIVGKEGISPSEILEDLQKIIAPYDVSILKTGEGLTRARLQLEELRSEKLSRMTAPDPHYLLKAEEVKSIADVTEYYLTSALFRTDSRAGHYRADYPEHYDDWLCWVVLKNVAGKPVPEKRTVPIEMYKHSVERYYSDNFNM